MQARVGQASFQASLCDGMKGRDDRKRQRPQTARLCQTQDVRASLPPFWEEPGAPPSASASELAFPPIVSLFRNYKSIEFIENR